MDSQIELLLKDMSYNATFRILDEAKDKNTLLEIAKNRSIVLPAQDLAVFETVYAFTDRQNKNGCTLPKAEVEKALATLIGKSIDLDHFRKSVVGHWIDAKLDGDKIIAYGCIFKGSFEKDYELIKELFDKGNLSVSFEAWGTRNFTGPKSYTLTDIEFAGGALLLKSEPAFDGADVLELAKHKNRVLEFAKVMTAPETFVHFDKKLEDNFEGGKMYVHDMNTIMRNMSQVSCPSCNEEGAIDPQMIDFENNKAKGKCVMCGAEMKIDMTPATSLTKKGRKIKSMSEYSSLPDLAKLDEFIKDLEISDKILEVSLEEALMPYPKLSLSNRFELTDEDFAIVKNIKLENSSRKIRVLPIHDLAHLNYAQELLNRPAISEFLQKLEISKESVERKLSRRIMTESMKDLLKKYNKSTVQEVIQEVAKVIVGRELSKEELEKAQLSVVNLQTLPKGSGGASDQALNKLGDAKDGHANDNQAFKTTAPASPQSLQNASEVTEEQLKSIIVEATKKVEVPVAVVESAEYKALKAQLDEATAKLTEATTKLTAIEQANLAAQEAKKTELVAARRAELTEEFAKELTDADLLDETKFELAKLKKENAELKKGGVVKSVVKAPDLSKGSKDKVIETASAEETSRARIREMAFGSTENKDSDEESE